MTIIGLLVAVALTGSLMASCSSSSSTQPWHTEVLDAEYTMDRADEVTSFADYLQLEQALFELLDRQVYAQATPGPGQALMRYNPGSLADPRGRIPDWNRSFELSVDNPRGTVLLLHGMTDSPYSLRALGQAFARHGFRVLGLRVPGHGTAPSGMVHMTWEDAASAVRLAARHLREAVPNRPLHLVGYSTGAALALDHALAARAGGVSGPAMPASLILVSPAIGVHPAAAFAGMKNTIGQLPGLHGLSWLLLQPEYDPYKYNSFATNAGSQVHCLTRAVAARIRIAADSDQPIALPPILVLKSAVDATVSTEAVVGSLLARVAPGPHELVLFDVNRRDLKSVLMVSDPGPISARLMADPELPFAVTLVTNANPGSADVVAHFSPANSAEVATTQALNAHWPPGVISLSHVALPFPPDDPLYGQSPPDGEILFLGNLALRGERGLLRIPESALLRMRYNPFYGYLEARAVDWIEHVRR